MPIRPVVFVGSSSEGRRGPEEVILQLDGAATVRPWFRGDVMKSGTWVLGNLLKEAARADFAIFTLRADDLVTSRQKQEAAPRDNVVYELGLFTGTLGVDRVFLLYEDDGRPKMPSDLKGLVYEPYRERLFEDSMQLACTKIRRRMEELGLRPRTQTFESIAEAHEHMYHLMSQTSVKNILHAAVATAAFVGNPVIDNFAQELEAFLHREDTCYDYVYLDHPDFPHRGERAQRARAATQRRNAVKVHRLDPKTFPNAVMLTFLIFEEREVVVFDSRDPGPDKSLLMVGPESVSAFRALFKGLKAYSHAG